MCLHLLSAGGRDLARFEQIPLESDLVLVLPERDDVFLGFALDEKRLADLERARTVHLDAGLGLAVMVVPGALGELAWRHLERNAVHDDGNQPGIALFVFGCFHGLLPLCGWLKVQSIGRQMAPK